MLLHAQLGELHRAADGLRGVAGHVLVAAVLVAAVASLLLRRQVGGLDNEGQRQVGAGAGEHHDALKAGEEPIEDEQRL